MIRLLWRTDVHNSDQNPTSRTDDWVETVASKLVEVGQLANQHECDAVLDGGDYWNDKTPIRTSHRIVSRTIRIHQRYHCPIYCTPGNHDLRLAQLDNLSENPLESLFASGTFRRLYDDHEAVFEKDGVKVRVLGIPYHGPRYDLDRFRAIARGDEDWLVCSAHVLASAQGGEMFAGEDIIRYSDLLELAPDVDVWCFGHWHKDQGIQEIAGGKWVVNVGSLTRGALTQDNIDREPGVVVMSFWSSDHQPHPKLDFIPITIRPSKDVFDLDKRVKEEARAMTVDAFVESLKEELQTSSKKDFSEIVRSSPAPDAVKERTLEYIEAAKA